MLLKMMTCSNLLTLPYPMWGKEIALSVSKSTNFVDNWAQFHGPHPGMIIATTVLWKQHLNRTYLRMWSKLICLKKQHKMLWTKGIQKQIWNKAIEICRSGKGYKAMSKVLNHSEGHYIQTEKAWNSGDLQRSGQPPKIPPRVPQPVIQKDNPD